MDCIGWVLMSRSIWKYRVQDDPGFLTLRTNGIGAKTDLPWMSIGYVTQVPPIYTLALYNAIANDGKLMKPYFVRSISKNGEALKTFTPTVIKEAICSKNTLVEIRKMLDSVVVHGTGKAVNSLVVSIAGKTGTAQLSKGSSGYQSGGKTHQVSFCGYFPARSS